METQGYNQDMAYDLRQRYAKIVGDHMEEVSIYRRERNYSEYFRSLENLYTITRHRFKTKAKKKAPKKIKKSYTELRQSVIDVANKYPFSWSGQGTNTTEIAEIEKALRQLEEYIYYRMNEANMFGSKRELEGLI